MKKQLEVHPLYVFFTIKESNVDNGNDEPLCQEECKKYGGHDAHQSVVVTYLEGVYNGFCDIDIGGNAQQEYVDEHHDNLETQFRGGLGYCLAVMLYVEEVPDLFGDKLTRPAHRDCHDNETGEQDDRHDIIVANSVGHSIARDSVVVAIYSWWDGGRQHGVAVEVVLN